MPFFSSERERRLWAWTVALVVAIYATLGLAATMAGALDRNTIAVLFASGMLLVGITVLTRGLRRLPGTTEVFVGIGAATVYLMLFLRMTLAERSHLIEYGVVALLVHEALTERASRGRRVPVPGLLAILITAAVGAVDELIQMALPNRHFAVEDMFFNLLAAFLAVATSGALAWARRKFT